MVPPPRNTRTTQAVAVSKGLRLMVTWRAAVVAAVVGSSTLASDDRSCPSGTEQRVERVGEGTSLTCYTADGRRQGPFTLAHTEGGVLTRGQFEDNRAGGWWQSRYPDGRPRAEGGYKAGQPHGWWTRWHANGQKEEEGEYRDGSWYGPWQAWDERGRLVSAIDRGFDCPAALKPASHVALIDLNPAGFADERRSCARSDDVRQGPAASWWFGRRKLAYVGYFCDGDAQGRWSFFWRNGVLAREGAFAGHSRKEGTWTDWDESGHKLREVDYVDGQEVARRDFPRQDLHPAPEAAMVDAVAVERYRDVLQRSCPAQPVTPRPFHGLREELAGADAVLRIRVTAVHTLDAPLGGTSHLPRRQEVEVLVRKVLSGSLARPQDRLRLLFDAATHWRRFELLPRFGDGAQFRRGPQQDRDQTALVKQEGDRLTLLTLMDADDRAGTDALLARYASLARRPDVEFVRGLAELIADRIRLAPDRLLWEGWGSLALYDWSRQATPPLLADPQIRLLATRTREVVEAQIERWLQNQEEPWNLYELPWLIRLLPLEERRHLAATLLRVYPVLLREDQAAQAEEEALPPPPDPEPGVVTCRFPGRWAAASAALNELMVSLAACVDPSADTAYPPDLLEKARRFAERH
jgi:antitoxin component YwqK of YwqJK toxin-antitoxin module